MNFLALHLEAAYQILCARGYQGSRKNFMALGYKVVSGMRCKGQL